MESANNPAAAAPAPNGRVVFFGNERLATGITTNVMVLQSLIAAGYDVAAVVVAQRDSGPSRTGREPEIVQIAEQHQIPVLSPDNLSDAADQLRALNADIGVLVAYGKIVPQTVIDIFPHGIINLHPSLLPKHRGPTPIESVLLGGEVETGVSIMQLTATTDAGPLYAQMRVNLEGFETKQALADELILVGKDMLHELLPMILQGSLQPTPQDDSQATCDRKIDKTAGEIDWQKPAVQLEREIRAYAGWPRSHTMLGRSDIIITAARVAPGHGTPGDLWVENRMLGIFTGQDVLVLDRLIPAGKQEMDGGAFMLGYQGGM